MVEPCPELVAGGNGRDERSIVDPIYVIFTTLVHITRCVRHKVPYIPTIRHHLTTLRLDSMKTELNLTHWPGPRDHQKPKNATAVDAACRQTKVLAIVAGNAGNQYVN